ncbi:MAG: hypothetical protein Kow0059_08940 [Candidatus Sumerlaeia bacterium]
MSNAWKRTVLMCFTAFCIVNLAMATTLIVDGPGDGNGDLIDQYDQIDLAINDLITSGLHNDSNPDVINIVVDTLFQSQPVYLNAITPSPGHSDDLTINGDADGNGTACTITFAEAMTNGNIVASPNQFCVAMDLASGQDFTLNDVVIIPEFKGAGALTTTHGGIGIDEANGSAALTNCIVTLNNVTITASTTGNTPVNPDSAPPADITRFAQNATYFAILTWGSSPTGSSGLVLNMTDVTVAHSFQDQIWFYQDTQTPGSNVVNMTRVRALRGTAATAVTDGIGASTADSLVVNMKDCEFSYNNNYGIANMGGASTAGRHLVLNILEGCVMQNNGFRGLSTGANQRTIIKGVEGNPVIIRNNGNRGVYTSSGTAATFGLIEHAQIYNNGVYGFEFNEIDLQTVPPVFNKVLFAQNGSVLTPGVNYSNFRIGDTNSAPATITFNDCTFHDVGATSVERSDATTSHSHIYHSYSGTDFVTYNFNRCIFSDGTLNDDVVMRVVAGDNNTINFNNCAFPTAGPHRLNQVASQHVTESGTATGTVINLNNVTNQDPQYLSTTPGDVHAFFVSGDQGSDYNNGGSNISGAGKFAPIISVSSIAFNVDGNLAEWFADAGPTSGTLSDFVVLGDQQAIYQDPTGDNLGGGAYQSPTNAAFANTSVDIKQVRVAQDANKLYFAIEQHGSGPGFGPNFETQGAFVALNYDSSGTNQFVFQEGKITMRPELTHDTHLMLGETGSGLQTAGNATGAQGAQDETVNGFEFAIDKSNLGGATVVDLIVGMGHSAGNIFRQVNSGAPTAFEGGFGVPGVSDPDNVRIYDLVGAEGADSQTADWLNDNGPFNFPMISASYLTFVLTGVPPLSVTDWRLHD